MSFLKRLFGGGAKTPLQPAPSLTETHAGFAIQATPYQDGSQWRLCGVVTKEIDGEKREHRFIRADLFVTCEEAEAATLRKARQLIDQEGERIFEKRG